MRTRTFVLLLVAIAAVAVGLAVARSQQAAPAADRILVYKTATCGCCGLWVDHLRAAGFTVEVRDVSPQELDVVATDAGVAPELRSCHTALVAGYAIEGHVPASDIARLLRERPAAAGIAVPGMPVGSPGMEMGDRRDPYVVVSFTRDGKRQVFAQYR